MSMRKKCIASLIMAASSVLISCASNGDVPPVVASYPPVIVDNYRTPSAAELYAQRYPSSVTQVIAGGQTRFAICEDDCPGATPKTSIANLNAAVTRRAEENRYRRSRTASADETPVAANQSSAQTEALDARTLIATAARPATAVAARVIAGNVSEATASGKQTTKALDSTPSDEQVAQTRRDSAHQAHADDVGER